MRDINYNTCVARYYGYVVSVEHMYDTFRKDLKKIAYPLAVSPLHTPYTFAEIIKENGEKERVQMLDQTDEAPFKHYHIQIDFGELVKGIYARKFARMLNCGGEKAEPIADPYMHYRYLTHLDDKNKEQFHFLHPDLYNGYEIPSPNLTDIECKIAIDKIVEDFNIAEFKDLKNYFRNSRSWRDFQLYTYCLSHTNFCSTICKSNLYYNLKKG